MSEPHAQQEPVLRARYSPERRFNQPAARRTASLTCSAVILSTKAGSAGLSPFPCSNPNETPCGNYWLNRKNCCVPEMEWVTVFCPLTTTGGGELVVQTGDRTFVVDCSMKPE